MAGELSFFAKNMLRGFHPPRMSNGIVIDKEYLIYFLTIHHSLLYMASLLAYIAFLDHRLL